ncbi:MAG: response regulator [Planctomycetes bacterium]|nr:response regulator [Planctomycetota bacterium]
MAYIIIIDDDEDFAKATATVLKNVGHKTHIETDTKSALNSIKENKPDLVLLDAMFPEDPVAGLYLARNIHQDESLKDIPILMLTAINAKFPLGLGSNDMDDVWLPVTDFLEKPIDLDILLSKVASLVYKGTYFNSKNRIIDVETSERSTQSPNSELKE